MIGDSWTGRFVRFDSFNRIFNENDRPDLAIKGDLTSFTGAEARERAQPENLAIIDAELAANPHLKVVQIMLGANGMLNGYRWNGWRAGITHSEEAAFLSEIATNIATVVDHARSVKPNVPILVTFYDYWGFEDVMKEEWLAKVWQPLLDNVDDPTPERYNQAMIDMAAAVIAEVGSRDNVEFVEYWGLMQNSFGFPDEGIAPGAITLPGDITRSSPAVAMGTFNWDPIHLSQEGYDVVARYLWDNFYADKLCITQQEYVDAITQCATNGGNPSILIKWMQNHRCK